MSRVGQVEIARFQGRNHRREVGLESQELAGLVAEGLAKSLNFGLGSLGAGEGGVTLAKKPIALLDEFRDP